MTRWPSLLFSILCTCLCASTALGVQLFAVQEQNSNIVTVDSTTGVVSDAFPLPDGIGGDVFDGLTLAENGSSLLFIQGIGPSPLYRMNPQTGEVLSIHTLETESGFQAGLSFDSANNNSIFVVDNGGGIGRQLGFDGPYTSPFVPSIPEIPGALGGDDFGRHFYNDVGGIQEFDPSSGQILNTLPFLGGLSGMAFDGELLYASSINNELLTLDPDTGDILNSVFVSGGSGLQLSALAATVPEPEAATIWILSAALLLATNRRHRK